MGKLGKGIVLIHELRQRRGAEKLLDSRSNRSDIDKSVRRKAVEILSLKGHSLTDNSFKPCKAYSELVLQKLAHRTYSSVAKVIDIVSGADAACKGIHVVYRRKDIVNDDVLGDKLVLASFYLLFKLLSVSLAKAVEYLTDNAVAHLLVDTALLSGVKIDIP